MSGALRWTRERPTEPGYYWLHRPWVEPSPQVVKVVRHVSGALKVIVFGNVFSLDQIGGEWAGPLEPPG